MSGQGGGGIPVQVQPGHRQPGHVERHQGRRQEAGNLDNRPVRRLLSRRQNSEGEGRLCGGAEECDHQTGENSDIL